MPSFTEEGYEEYIERSKNSFAKRVNMLSSTEQEHEDSHRDPMDRIPMLLYASWKTKVESPTSAVKGKAETCYPQP